MGAEESKSAADGSAAPGSAPKPRSPQQLLEIAAQRGVVEEVHLQLAAGADVNASLSDDRTTPLHLACMRASFRSDAACIEALLAAKPQVNRGDRSGAAALHHVVQSMSDVPASTTGGALAALRLLISAGANVNLARGDGWTPLHIAVTVDNAEAVRVLLAAGAKPDLRVKDGRNALGVARMDRERDLSVVKLLLAAGVSLDTMAGHEKSYSSPEPLWCHAMRNAALLDLLVPAGFNVHQRGKKGETLLCHTDREDVLRRLIALGVSVNHRADGGRTPLMCMPYQYAFFPLLVDAGAEVNARDKDGCTLLHYVAGIDVNPMCTRRPDTELIAPIKYLLSVGADPTIKNKDGATPLDLAVKRNNVNAVATLESVRSSKLV